jgi:hypothetical protein
MIFQPEKLLWMLCLASYQGPTLEAAEKLMFCIRARL